MGDMDPHIYAVSEEAFKLMERDNTNQVTRCLVSTLVDCRLTVYYCLRGVWSRQDGVSQVQHEVGLLLMPGGCYSWIRPGFKKKSI